MKLSSLFVYVAIAAIGYGAWTGNVSALTINRTVQQDHRHRVPETTYCPARESPRPLQQERSLPPRDDAGKDPSFAKFRESLFTAIKQKNLNYLEQVVDPDINFSFGDDPGLKGFEEFWKLDDPKSDFWDEFLRVLNLGGVLSEMEGKTYFTAPYYFELFPDDLDPTEYEVIISKDASLRVGPNDSSKEVAKLSYNFVKVDLDKSVPIGNPDDFKFSWFKVTTLGGKSGFVASKDVGAPLDYRAVFVKNGNEWRMIAFVAGD